MMITCKVFSLLLVLADSLRIRRSELEAAEDDYQKETTTSNPYTYSVTSNIISDLPFTPTPGYYSPTPLYSPTSPSPYPTKQSTTKILLQNHDRVMNLRKKL